MGNNLYGKQRLLEQLLFTGQFITVYISMIKGQFISFELENERSLFRIK